MSKSISLDDVLKFLEVLPFGEFKKVVNHYASSTGSDLDKEMASLVTLNFQQRLEKLNINSVCPKCSSKNIKKFGMRNNIQVYKCKDCSSKFTRFTGTILEKSRWHWDIWIKVLEMTINEYSLQDMINVLEKDYGCTGINYKTVWMWRIKLIHALASFPMPKLTGIVQVDETFIREAQKGSRHLESTISTSEDRKPRYGRRPSKLGVMGPEFANVVTAIDNRGYCVCKVSGLGRVTKEIFFDMFEPYLDNPSYICSDANSIYEDYCNLKHIPHYEKPSNYLTMLNKNGYETPDFSNPVKAKATQKTNRKILEKLYKAALIDRITNMGFIDYEKFETIKNANSLSLARVNELHNDIKKFIYKDMTNVSTKYLQDYIGFFTYIRNWKVTNGHYPTSTKDAEAIFIDILQSKVNYTVTDVENAKLELPKPTSRYITVLKEETKKARAATANKYFKFNEEDGFKTFNKREYLLDQPKTKLYNIAKECKLTKYRQLALWSLVSKILEQPNIDDIIYKLLESDRAFKVDEEDLEAIRDSKFYL